MSIPWRLSANLSGLFGEYGMLLVLLLLCVAFSWVTYGQQHPTGAPAAEQLAVQIIREHPGARVLIAAGAVEEDEAFAATLQERLTDSGVEVVAVARGQPADARRTLERLAGAGRPIDLIAADQVTASWAVFDDLSRKFPALGNVALMTPRSYWWPSFLRRDNLLHVASQIVVIAVLAIGMTMVIITGGIALSVGSLIALSAVTATLLIRQCAGAEGATAAGITVCCVAAIGLCALVGTFSGLMVTSFAIPPFIATLAIMLVANGAAYILSGSQSIYQLPASFQWLGLRADMWIIPNAVVLTVLLYCGAHAVMTRTRFGRYIYAVGGNREAARLSGVSVNAVLVAVYAISGTLAGLGGIIMASRLKCGSPTYGVMYELYVIAAVVVGGASLAGGEGRVFGTLIGALVIAVVNNGMNLTGVDSHAQKIVLGAVILGAVLLDILKKRGLRRIGAAWRAVKARREVRR